MKFKSLDFTLDTEYIINVFLELQIHYPASGVNGATGASALKLVVLDLGRGFAQIQLCSLEVKVALLQIRRRKAAKYGPTIVKVLILLNEIYLCIWSDFTAPK